MWRLIVVTFVVMVWAFYELSGGADFRPASEMSNEELIAIGIRPASEETRARLAAQAAVREAEAAERARTEVAASAQEEAQDGVIVLDVNQPQEEAAPQLPDAPFLASAPAISAMGMAAQEAIYRADLPEAPPDVWLVAGSRVNMRAGPGTDYGVITVLTRGDETEILEDVGDGWVYLRVLATGEEGYMARRLLSQ